MGCAYRGYGPVGRKRDGRAHQRRAEELFERVAGDPQHRAEVDDRQARPTIGSPPLSSEGVRLGPADAQKAGRFLHSQ